MHPKFICTFYAGLAKKFKSTPTKASAPMLLLLTLTLSACDALKEFAAGEGWIIKSQRESTDRVPTNAEVNTPAEPIVPADLLSETPSNTYHLRQAKVDLTFPPSWKIIPVQAFNSGNESLLKRGLDPLKEVNDSSKTKKGNKEKSVREENSTMTLQSKLVFEAARPAASRSRARIQVFEDPELAPSLDLDDYVSMQIESQEATHKVLREANFKVANQPVLRSPFAKGSFNAIQTQSQTTISDATSTRTLHQEGLFWLDQEGENVRGYALIGTLESYADDTILDEIKSILRTIERN